MNLADFLKTCGILVVIAFHALKSQLLLGPLYLALGMFFFLAGVFWKPDPIKFGMKRMLPYVLGLVLIPLTNPFWPVGSYIWFLWALIIYEISAYLAFFAPIIISGLIFLLSMGSELSIILLAFSVVYVAGLLSSHLKPCLTVERSKNLFFEVVGKNTLWIYVFLIQFMEVVI